MECANSSTTSPPWPGCDLSQPRPKNHQTTWQVLNSKAEATVTCGYSGPSNTTTVPLSAFTAADLMKGTTVGVAPSDAEVLDMARVLLGMPQ